MNYTFVGNFQNIKYFLAEGSHSAIFDKEYNLKLDGADFDKSNGHFFFLEDRLYYSKKGQDGKTVIFDMKTNLSEEVDTVLMKNTLHNNTFLQSTDLQMDENHHYSAKISVFQFNPAKKLYDLPKRYTDYQRLRIGDFLLTERPKYLLSSLSLLTGEYEWEVDLGGRFYDFHGEGKEAGIREIIGVYQDWLLVELENRHLLAIDLPTGRIAWEKYPFESASKNPFSSPFLDVKRDCIFWYTSKMYYSFNLQTQKGEVLKSYQDEYFLIERNFFTEDYVYFIGNSRNAKQAIGVFNRNTLVIDWEMEYIFEEKMVGFLQIQATNDKIYALDNRGTLHIFEREG